MNLRAWISNNDEVNATFTTADKAEVKSLKVLGHKWNIADDTISLKTTITNSSVQNMTKRLILKRIASIFDPMGLICPVMLPVKVFLQNLWSKNLDWDEHLCDKDQKIWATVTTDLENLSQCCVSRCITRQNQTDVEYRLLCFSDASEKAYAAVIYLNEMSGQRSTTNLVFAKSRLNPLKKISIPRLELLAVVIGLRCLKFVREQIKLPVYQSYLWTDSQCVLHWINSKKPLSVFVKNRVKEINDSTGISISYVPSKENPADIASRGTSTVKLLNCELWWNGPKWLQQAHEEWPTFDCNLDDKTQREYELELCKKKCKETSLVQPSSAISELEVQQVTYETPFGIDSRKFSSVTRLLRITVLALRFIRILQRRTYRKGHITNDEIQESEQLWIRHIQRNHFKNVFEAMSTNKKSNLQRQLNLYLDQFGLLRCKGRLENACLTENARCPILLPKMDWYTKLDIEKTHKEILHSGVSQTLSRIRLRFWIPHGHAVVKTVLKSCTVCRRFEGGSYKTPPLCSFPKARVTESTPFSFVGLDYMGSLYVKINESRKKVWICLFTCIVTRAIHLEVVHDMSSEEFLLCFRRFIAQRGTPCEIISDNAMQFRASSTVLDRIWNKIQQSDEIMSYVSNAGIKWRFNVELAPWMGGFYERLIGLVKRSLRKTIGRRLLTTVQLQTLLKEIEAVLNSRPLVYVGDDINSNIPITPAHFLALNPKIGIPQIEISEDKDFQPAESTTEKLLQMWKKGQRLLDMFWKSWKHEYLTSLRERTQTCLKTGRVHSEFLPKINDVVIVKDDTTRGNWKFGKVTELQKSRDGNTRSVKVLIPSGKEIGRPLNLLYPLEVTDQSCDENENTTPKTKEERETHSSRPKRYASEVAKNIEEIIRNE